MDTYGPPLPPGFKLPTGNEDSESEDEQPAKKVKVIGPQIPSFIVKNLSEDLPNSPENEVQSTPIIGPVLPNTLNSSDADDHKDVYGPMPPKEKVDYDIVNIIEKRATNMKNKLDNKDAPVVENAQREEWMIVPDTSSRNQLGAISRCLAPGSKIHKKETDSYHNPEEDKKTSEELKKYNKSKRGESLLEMHRKKKKKKDKEKSSEKKERKPFDRDEIGVRLFTSKQVNSVVEKSKYLNSRFAPGKGQFL